MDTHFDNLVDQFEDELKSGNAPDIKTYLTKVPKDFERAMLLQLISLEVFHRGKKGLPVKVSDYVKYGQSAVLHAERELRGDAPTTDDLSRPPETIDRYRLLQKIGEGGMGAVWLAEQVRPIKRRVALKLVKSELASKEVIARFEAEQQALGMMNHVNIARVFDAGTADGWPYIAMELVNGLPITEYCDDNKLSIDERIELFIPVCKAVQHAHQKGILHRDLKPSNVLVALVDGQATPKIIDFGMAKATEHNLRLTEKTIFTEYGKVVGTLQYMSPEQAQLSRLDVDTRTDIYSLGVMLYELLTGFTPLDRETLDQNALLKILEIIREKDPPRPSYRLSSSSHDLNTEVGEQRRLHPAKLQQLLKGELDWVVMKALEKDRTRRYQTANDLAKDLSNYLTSEPIHARPPSTKYQIQKFASRNRGLFAAMLAVGTMLLAGIAGTSYGLVKANEKTKLAQEKIREADAERARAKANEKLALAEMDKAQSNEQRAAAAEELAAEEARRAHDAEASAKFQLANARWDANRARDARDLLYAIPMEYRDNFEWRFCHRQFLGSDITCYGHQGRVYCVAISPDGTRMASASGDKLIKLWDTTTGGEIATIKGHRGRVTSVAISPDGTRLASADMNATIKLWDLHSTRELLTMEGHGRGTIHEVAFSPDNSRLASASDDSTIKLWDVKTGEELKNLQGHEGSVMCVAFNPDGTRIASGAYDGPLSASGAVNDGLVRVWDAHSGKQIAALDTISEEVSSVAFSPDGATLASSGFEAIQLWNARTFRELETLRGHSDWVNKVAFSPDGRQLVSAAADGLIKIWDVRRSQKTITLAGHTGGVESIDFSPDGGRIVSGGKDNLVKLWDIRSGQPMTLRGHTLAAKAVTFSPDGARIATASSDTTVKIWEVQSGKEVKSLKHLGGQVDGVAMSSDGLSLASCGFRVSLWDIESAQRKEVLELPAYSTTVAFSPDSTQLACGDQDGNLKLWNLLSGKLSASLTQGDGWIYDVAYSADSERLATAGPGTEVRLWNARTGKELPSLVGHSRNVTSIAFRPDGRRLASGGFDNLVKLWDVDTGKELVSLKGHTSDVHAVAFSPDGTRIATASQDMRVKLWDASTGQELKTFHGHKDWVNDVAFSPDGESIVSAGEDGSVLLWTARPQQEVITFSGHKENVDDVTFSADGKLLYSRSGDEKLVWDLATQALLVDHPWDPPKERLTTSPDGRWLACSESNYVHLVDVHYKNTAWEKGYRIAKGRVDPSWHQARAEEAVDVGDWYAATFHFALLMQHVPDNQEFQIGLESSYQQLAQQYEAEKLDVDALFAHTIIGPLNLLAQIANANEMVQQRLPVETPIDVSVFTYAEPESEKVIGKFSHAEGKIWREENGDGVFEFEEKSRNEHQLVLCRTGLDMLIDFKSKEIIWRGEHWYDVVSTENREEASRIGDDASGNAQTENQEKARDDNLEQTLAKDVSLFVYSEPGSVDATGKFVNTDGKRWREINGNGVFEFQEKSRNGNQLILRRDGVDMFVDFQTKKVIWRNRHTYDVISTKKSDEVSAEDHVAAVDLEPNPSFEKPGIAIGSFEFVDFVPWWRTTDKQFEIWSSGFQDVEAYDGKQFVELNANEDGTLYKDSIGIQRDAVIEFSFAHRGRNGEDTLKLTITDLGADDSFGGGDDQILFTKEYTTGKEAWAVYDSATEPKIVAQGNKVRFAYSSVYATGGKGPDNTEGNFLDSAEFGVGVVTAKLANSE